VSPPWRIANTARLLDEKNRLRKRIHRKRTSPIQVPEKPSAFHPRAQRNASRRRDARQQSRSFALGIARDVWKPHAKSIPLG
jgi:hypothetical protein